MMPKIPQNHWCFQFQAKRLRDKNMRDGKTSKPGLYSPPDKIIHRIVKKFVRKCGKTSIVIEGLCPTIEKPIFDAACGKDNPVVR